MLDAPQSYRDATPEQVRAVTNGCGPGGASAIVPDRILGLYVGEACQIHDWEYGHVEDELRGVIDRRLLSNLYRLIDNAGGWLRWPRRFFAWWGYQAVDSFGGPRYGKS